MTESDIICSDNAEIEFTSIVSDQPHAHDKSTVSSLDDTDMYDLKNVERKEEASTFSCCDSDVFDLGSYSEKCKSNCMIGSIGTVVCLALGLGFGLGFEPHVYRVYNRESKTITLRYRPGCTETKDDSTTTVDCIKNVYSGNHARIFISGHLTELCATYSNYFHGFGQECTTDKGLQNDFNWYVHNGLTFTRGKNKGGSVAYNSTDDLTDDFYEDYSLKTFNVDETSTSNNLRGSSLDFVEN